MVLNMIAVCRARGCVFPVAINHGYVLIASDGLTFSVD